MKGAMGDLGSRRVGIALVLSTALISGVSIYVNRFAVATIPSSVFTGTKNLLTALVFAVVLLAAREARTLVNLPRGDWARLAGIGLIGGAIPFLLFFQGLSMVVASGVGGTIASFLHKTMFLYVAVFAFMFLKERLYKLLFVAAVLLIAGMTWMIAPSFGGSLAGMTLILVATVFWAAEFTLSKATLRRLGANLVIFGRMGFGAAFIMVYLAATGQLGTLVGLSGAQWQWILVTTAFLVFFVGTFYHGLKRIDVTSAVSLLVLGGAVTLGLNWILAGGTVNAPQAFGMLLIVLGIVATVLRALRHPPAEEEKPVAAPGTA